jgi:MFS transporter, ACS family, hexuronate transporter
MPLPLPDISLPPRRPAWKWWICGLLLLATMLNYMDRLTLNLTGKQIMQEFGLDEADYAQLESAFAFAFALGAIIFGWLADRTPIRWLYPAAVLAWSFAGFSAGLAGTFAALLLCRALLGLFEAGNWPCALRTTQHILPPGERAMGNSILQSGAALGAIFTPLIVLGLGWLTDSWRPAFLAIGVIGVTWAFLWVPSVGRGDLEIPRNPGEPTLVSVLAWLILLLAIDTAVRMNVFFEAPPWLPRYVKGAVTALGIAGVFLWLRHATRDDRHLPKGLFFCRFWVLVVLVVAINTTWHYFRVWLPLFLQTPELDYDKTEVQSFSSAYYIATDIGSLTSGFVALLLVRRGMAVHWSRVTVFAVCALLTLLSLAVPFLRAGPLLLGVLLVIGFASLALFPIYYSFSQELTVRHQGKVTGALGCINWLAMALLHELAGASIQATKSYDQGLALAGLAPLVGFAVLMLLWRPAPMLPQLGETPAGPVGHVQAAAASEQFTAQNPCRQPDSA